MATKTRRATASTSQLAGPSTPREKPDSPPRKGTPSSPARVTRLEEKAQLQNLNDRLATYIEQVRALELQNKSLGTQVTTVEEKFRKEIRTSKDTYEKEIAYLRGTLDATGNEKAQALIEKNNWQTNFNDLQKKFQKKDKDLAALEKNFTKLEARNNDLQNDNNRLASENKKLSDECKEAVQEQNSMESALSKAKDQLNANTLLITDLENRLQSLKEELTFRETVHEKELSDERTLKTVEISGIDLSIRDDYDQKLAESLRELRDQYESQMVFSNQEIANRYESKLMELQNQVSQKMKSAKGKEDEARSAKSRIEFLSSQVSQIEAVNESLKSRIRDLEAILAQEREWHNLTLQSKDEEIKALQDEAQQNLQEYQDLLGIKVALDMEIAAYRKLLEQEEGRLNITPKGFEISGRGTPVRRTPIRATKRKRAHFESEETSTSNEQVSSTAKTDVEIHDHDAEGKYIKLFNKGNTEIPLGGWQLIRKAGEQETMFKFHRTTVIKANSYITVWSSDSGVAHSPPTDFVMKGQRWFTSDVYSSVLLNNSGEEMAGRETSKKTHRSLEQRSMGEFAPEEMYHQRGDLKERCVLM